MLKSNRHKKNCQQNTLLYGWKMIYEKSGLRKMPWLLVWLTLQSRRRQGSSKGAQLGDWGWERVEPLVVDDSLLCIWSCAEGGGGIKITFLERSILHVIKAIVCSVGCSGTVPAAVCSAGHSAYHTAILYMKNFLQFEEISSKDSQMSCFGGEERRVFSRHFFAKFPDISSRHAVSFFWGPLKEFLLKEITS